MKTISIARIPLVIASFWLISAMPFFAQYHPGPSRVWVIGSGSIRSGFVEYTNPGGIPKVTRVLLADRWICSFDQPVEIVAGGFAAGLLALGIGAGTAVRGFRNRRPAGHPSKD